MSDDFLFGDSNSGSGGSSYHTLQQGSSVSSSTIHHKSGFLKSLTNLTRQSTELRRTHTGGSSNNGAGGPTSDKVIGASHSHFDVSITSDHRSHSRSRSVSPDRRSGIYSMNKPKSPKSKLHMSTFTSTSKRLSRESVDDDNDWNDNIDNITSPDTPKYNIQFYPDLNNLKINDESSATLSDSLAKRDLSSDLIQHQNSVATGPEPEAESEDDDDSPYPFLKKNYEELMKDPYKLLTTQVPPVNDTTRYNKIVKALTKPQFDMNELRKQSWSGIPESLRSLVWQVLLGYLPANASTRESVLGRKRKEYTNSMGQLFRGEKEQTVWHQITIDIPRTNPSVKLYSFETTQRSLEKILYLWAIRHPASG
ncbi:unnamed protein product [Ambrosiozyma monospora]|uniref:Unnamed protein product n=1 Tax=Ambrosiozyma monospora TaxID=43982 RepID=A0ACB5TJ52_AMBMO|nr:unnamed protein product [Ambrosiozyma monospora]